MTSIVRLHAAALASIAVCVGLALASEQSASFDVRYRSAETVYLEGGRAEGLSIGDHLEILRGGEVVARIEIMHLSEHSASCKILMEQEPIESGDRARLDGELAIAPATTAGATDAALAPEAMAAGAAQRKPRPRTRVSGSFAVDWEQFTDESGRGWDYDRNSTRLNLRVRDIAGRPLDFVVRTRTVEWNRASGVGGDDPQQDQRNRLYEVSLTYAPPKGRFALSAGRLGTSPFVGIGYLDGVLGQVRVGGGFDVGAFYGARPVIKEFGFDNAGTKYGAYTRFRSNRTGAPRGVELYLAGVREDGEEGVSREYATFEIHYRSGGRWTFSQYTAFDFNQGWREQLSESGVQLSNLSIVANGRLSSSTRLLISYDRNQLYRTEETRYIPEELFDLLWRQGFRVKLQVGRPGRLQFSIDGGIRERQDDPDKTYSAGAGLYGSNVFVRGLSIGGSLSLFSNPYTDGFTGNFRVAKNFRGGHQVFLVLGTLVQQYDTFNRDLNTSWVRVGFWVELPARLYLRSELEYDAGNDLEGARLNVGIGYRF